MKKSATEIAYYVLLKLAEPKRESLEDYIKNIPSTRIMRGVGAGGGGLLGGLFGGAAGAGLGSAIREFPGYVPKTQAVKLLTKTIRNPMSRGIANALPFLGLGAGAVTGAHSGYKLFDVPGPKLTEKDVKRILAAYAERIS